MSLWSAPNLTTPGLWMATWRRPPHSHFLPVVVDPSAPPQSTALSIQPPPRHPSDLDPPTPPWLAPSGAPRSTGRWTSQLIQVRRTPLCARTPRQGLLEYRVAWRHFAGLKKLPPSVFLEACYPLVSFSCLHHSVTNPRDPSDSGAVPGGLWAHPLHSEKNVKGSLSASWLLL